MAAQAALAAADTVAEFAVGESMARTQDQERTWRTARAGAQKSPSGARAPSGRTDTRVVPASESLGGIQGRTPELLVGLRSLNESRRVERSCKPKINVVGCDGLQRP